MIINKKQKVYVAGGFKDKNRNKCFSVTSTGAINEETEFYSNAEETDLRIWLHCLLSNGTRKLIYSRDTDVYHIGLPLVLQQAPALDVFVQQSPSLTMNSQFVSLLHFIRALDNDPDIVCVPNHL